MDQNTGNTKAFTVFAFVDFGYRFLYAEVGDRLGFTTLTFTINLKIKHLVYRHHGSFP